MDELQEEKMNMVPVIVRNPAYIEEVEPDEDEVDPADISPLVSGDAPIVTVPASEDENVVEDVVEDSDEDEEMQDILDKMKKLDTEVKELRKEIMDLLSSIPEDTSSLQSADVPQVEVWDTGKAWEQEYRLHPDPSIDKISSRLFNQVWDLLQILQERVDQRTCNNKDIKLIDGLNAISVMHARLGKLTEKTLKRVLTNNYVNSLSLCNVVNIYDYVNK